MDKVCWRRNIISYFNPNLHWHSVRPQEGSRWISAGVVKVLPPGTVTYGTWRELMTFLACLYFHDQRIFIKRKMVISVKCDVLIGRGSGRSARVRGQDILKKTQSLWEKSRPPSQNWTSNQAPLSPQKASRDKYHQLVLTWELVAKYRELTTILPAHLDPPL